MFFRVRFRFINFIIVGLLYRDFRNNSSIFYNKTNLAHQKKIKIQIAEHVSGQNALFFLEVLILLFH